MSHKRRILIISHGHPDFSKGGAEIAAYHLYEELCQRKSWNGCFMGHHDVKGIVHTGTPFATYKKNDILLHSHVHWFNFSQRNPETILPKFIEVLEHLKPTLVHFHHYTKIGIELIRAVKNWNPKTPVVLTLHEYLAMCHHNGQMIKVDRKLCYTPSPANCHQCYPEIAPSEFFLRELYVKSFFNLVDQFIAPSRFLLNRYVSWGLPKEKLICLENGQPLPASDTPPRTVEPGESRGRFAYFGQITAYKGLDILLEAISLLPAQLKQQISLDVYGSSLDSQSAELQAKIDYYFESEKQCVRYHGGYEGHELPGLMAEIDWVVTPSIWWENSPLVIQEAFKYKRPVICSNIGGMAEKVGDGVTGLHFSAQNPGALAACLEKAATTDGLWDQLVANIRMPISIQQSANEHIAVYEKLIAQV